MVRSSSSATCVWTRPRLMYLSCVMDTLACPSWSAPIRADRPSSSISVATVLRNECDVTSGTPRSSRTPRQRRLRPPGSRSVPSVDGKIIGCSPRNGSFRRSTNAEIAKRGKGMVRLPASLLVSSNRTVAAAGQHPNNPNNDRTTPMTNVIKNFAARSGLLQFNDDVQGVLAPWDSRGRFHASGPSPAVAAGANAGTGATAALVGDDSAGTVTVTTGTTPAAGALAVVTFAAAWSVNAPFVALLPKTAAAASLGVYATTTTTTLTLPGGNLPTASSPYTYDYQVVGAA